MTVRWTLLERFSFEGQAIACELRNYGALNCMNAGGDDA